MSNEPYSEYAAIIEQGKQDFEIWREGRERSPWKPTPESIARDEANRVKAQRELDEIRNKKSFSAPSEFERIVYGKVA